MKRVVVEVEDSAIGEQHALCDHPDCSHFFKEHYWGSIGAQKEGWFLQKNGDCWCPEHIPEWYFDWKSKKEETKRRWGK
jgi:hypothetical protein